jgi:hypothetical protein
MGKVRRREAIGNHDVPGRDIDVVKRAWPDFD